MNAEEALGIVEKALDEDRLSKLQVAVFLHTWNELSYQEIARDSGYEIGYIKQTGSQLWQTLSNAFGEKVRKGNVHIVLKRYVSRRQKAEGREQAEKDAEAEKDAGTRRHGDAENSSIQSKFGSADSPEAKIQKSPPHPSPLTPHFLPLTDWGEATDVSIFYGRTEELATLERWVGHDRCRLIGLFGMGGIGKTALSVKLAQQVSSVIPTPFTHVIWRSLRNAPPIDDLLADLILFLSRQQETVLPGSLDRCILLLLEYLRNFRCLLILDNAETIMQAGDRGGGYQSGYEGYGQLLRCVGETDHQSCLLLTSREKPKGFAPKEGAVLPVRSLQVTGLAPTIGRELFHAKGRFSGSTENWQVLIQHYAGNPLALKIVATAIADFFDGSVAQFLEFIWQGNSVFGDIRDLLTRQIGRLSNLEQQVMIWLAVDREPVSFTELQADCVSTASPTHLLDTLTALERRSLIEKSGSLFTLQPAVMEYMTEWLIEQVCEEIGNGQGAMGNGQVEGRRQETEEDRGMRGHGDTENLTQNSKLKTQNSLSASLLRSHALIKAQAKDYIRETQMRLVLKPIADRLLHSYNRAELDNRLMQILSAARGKTAQETGYAGGNVINLLCQLQVDLSDRDFSYLTLWQAYLRKVTLYGTNLAHSNLTQSVFTETFSQILAVAFSSDGKLLAASDISYEVHIWRVTDGKKLLTCKASDGWAWSLTFSPDSQLLASSANGTIHLWDVQTGECVKTICGYTSRVFSLAFSPDGCLLASGNEDHEIRIWNIATGELVAVLSEHTDEVHSVVFSPNSRLLASGSYDRTIKLWDVSGVGRQRVEGRGQRAEEDAETRGHGDAERKAEGRGQRAGEENAENSIQNSKFKIQNSSPSLLTPHSSLLTLPGHTHWVWSVAFSPDGKTLASSSSDRTLKLWDIQTGHCIKTLVGHTQPIRSVAFVSPSQKAEGRGQKAEGEELKNLKDEEHTVPSLLRSSTPSSLTPSSPHLLTPYLVSGSDDRTVRIWNTEGDCLRVLQGHTSWISSVAVSSDGCLLASGSEDQSVRLWNSRTNHCLRVLQGYNSGVWSIAFSPDGKTLISGGQDRMVRLWNLEEAEGRGQKAEGRRQKVEEDTKTRGQGDAENALIQNSKFKIQNFSSSLTLSGHASWIWSVALSPDGRAIASGSEDGTINLWDVSEPGRQESEASSLIQNSKLKTQNSTSHPIPLTPHPSSLIGHTHAVWSVAFSPNGRIIASGSLDGTVRLWDRSTEQCQHVLQQHRSGVWSVAFAPNLDTSNCDRQLLASGSQDQTIQLWEITTNLCSNNNEQQPELVVHSLRTLEGHVSWIRCIVFSPDGQFLASASSDGSVKLWQVNTGECLQTFQAHSSLVLAVTFSPDGQTLATGGGDGTIKVWDVSEGRRQKAEEQDSTQHSASIQNSKLKTQNSKPSSSISTPYFLLPTPLITLQGHDKWVRFLAYSPSGSILASCSQDGSVKLWNMQPDSLSTKEMYECIETFRVPRPYEGVNITGITGLTEAQKETLKMLGAIDESSLHR